MEEEKTKEILLNYKDMVKNIYEALRLAGMPESMIVYNTINLPDLSRMLPEDVVNFFAEVKTMTIVYLSDRGFSIREIERRIGGSSALTVTQVLKEYRPTPSKVEKKLSVEDTK